MTKTISAHLPGFVLIHGYTGSTRDLEPLEKHLTVRFEPESVSTVHLPGHMTEQVPCFDQDSFVESVAEAANAICLRKRLLILIGHSTGGTIALKAILEKGLKPAMLFLVATPKKIDGSALERWERHRRDKPAIALGDIARMVSSVNQIGATQFTFQCPLWILHGIADSLVPVSDALDWLSHGFVGTVRQLLVPEAGHDIFSGKSGMVVVDWIVRMVRDFLVPQPDGENARSVEQLIRSEGHHLSTFLTETPSSRTHILHSPGARHLLGLPFELLPMAGGDPVQINVEVTTRCNLSCSHCARRVRPRHTRDMPVSWFEYILDLLPNAYRIMLAGLGEPTLHPKIQDIIRSANKRYRLIGLVTNAARLDRDLATRLVDAGLNSIVFSLDSVDDRIVSDIRPGVHIDQVLANIQDFTCRTLGTDITTAVFTSVSTRTVHGLPQLAKIIADLNVQAWMLTDLNFEWNQPHSMAQHWSTEARDSVRSALRIAFSKELPVLSVIGLETFGMPVHYRRYLLYPPERLSRRSQTRTECLSPWQTIPVDVDGNATFCDCQPDVICGNLLKKPFSDIWNGESIRALRSRMTQIIPPKPCRICPRF